jgi:MFS family permease
VGATLFLLGMVTLLLALDQGHAWGWGSAATLGALAGALALLILFVRVELRRPAPMLDLTLFQSRVFAGSTAAAVLNYICLFAMLFLLPFYLIQARGLNAAHAGLLLTAQPLMMAISAPISGARSDRIGTRAPAVVGMAVLGLGLWMLTRVGAHTSFGWLELSLAVAGLGTGIFISPNNSALLGAAPPERKGIASGVLSTARNVGMVLGVALAGAIYASISQGQPGPAGVIASLHLGMWITAGLASGAAVISAIR